MSIHNLDEYLQVRSLLSPVVSVLVVVLIVGGVLDVSQRCVSTVCSIQGGIQFHLPHLLQQFYPSEVGSV